MGAPSTDMSDIQRPKPVPARLPGAPPTDRNPTPPAAGQPIPAPPVEGAPAAGPEEVEVVGPGGTWIARVIGKSGRASARSAPLILVGFRERASASDVHTLESTVPGRRLADLTADALEAALARAKAPPAPDQRRPFFEDADAPRRSGPASEY